MFQPLTNVCLPPTRDDSCWSLFVRLHKFLFGEIRFSSFFKRVTSSYRTTRADAYVNHAQTSAARVVTNLIKLKHCRVKKTVSPSTPTCWRQAPSFRSRRNTISHRETRTQQANKTTRNRDTKTQSSLCRSVLCQVMWHSSSCSLNELLTPVLRADVSTGKLDSRFPVNKPRVLQIKVCWNDSSCYKSTTKLTFHKMNSKPSKHFQKFSKQTGSHPNVNNQPISHKMTNFSRTKWFT